MSFVLLERRTTMKADVGDRLITEGPNGSRECLIIGLHRADGTPPYVVRWQADGHIALVFPGPYTRLVHSAKDFSTRDCSADSSSARFSSAEFSSAEFSSAEFSSGDVGAGEIHDEALRAEGRRDGDARPGLHPADGCGPEGDWSVQLRESHDIN